MNPTLLAVLSFVAGMATMVLLAAIYSMLT
jgi:hypothetical protein